MMTLRATDLHLELIVGVFGFFYQITGETCPEILYSEFMRSASTLLESS